MHRAAGTGRRGFARIEACAVLGVIACAVSVLSVASEAGRSRARSAGSVANLQKYASGVTSFAADNEERIVSFSWRPGVNRDRTGYVFPVSATRVQAGADQAVSILRWNAKRLDITAISGWLAHVGAPHLALVEHLDHPLPAEFVVSPHDVNRLAWQRSVRNQAPGEAGAGYFALVNRPAGAGNSEKRWAYSSSYEFAPASFSPDARQLVPGGGTIPTVQQDPMGHRWYTTGNAQTQLGERRVSEIVYPSKKVLVYETYVRGEGGGVGAFYASSGVRTPMLFGDGSVSMRVAASANAGFYPNLPLGASPTRIQYVPELGWEPPTVSGNVSEYVNGGVRWCRSGLRGRDFDGAEVQWAH